MTQNLNGADSVEGYLRDCVAQYESTYGKLRDSAWAGAFDRLARERYRRQSVSITRAMRSSERKRKHVIDAEDVL